MCFDWYTIPSCHGAWGRSVRGYWVTWLRVSHLRTSEMRGAVYQNQWSCPQPENSCGHRATRHDQGAVSIKRCRLTCIGIPTLKIRRSCDRLIFNMGIPILVRRHLYIETAPRSPQPLAHTSFVWTTNHLYWGRNMSRVESFKETNTWGDMKILYFTYTNGCKSHKLHRCSVASVNSCT